MTTLHNYLIRTLSVYHNWHQTKHHNTIHWGVFVVFTLLVFGMILRWAPISFAADTAAPTIPTNLTAAPISSSQINLSWTASTDDLGVTGYKIYRCAGSACTPSTQIATSATNSYSNTGLTAFTAYTYAVSAYDAVGNESGKSTVASATTQSGVAQSWQQTLEQNFDIAEIFDNMDDWKPGTSGIVKIKDFNLNGTNYDGPVITGTTNSRWDTYKIGDIPLGYDFILKNWGNKCASGKCLTTGWNVETGISTYQYYSQKGPHDMTIFFGEPGNPYKYQEMYVFMQVYMSSTRFPTADVQGNVEFDVVAGGDPVVKHTPENDFAAIASSKWIKVGAGNLNSRDFWDFDDQVVICCFKDYNLTDDTERWIHLKNMPIGQASANLQFRLESKQNDLGSYTSINGGIPIEGFLDQLTGFEIHFKIETTAGTSNDAFVEAWLYDQNGNATKVLDSTGVAFNFLNSVMKDAQGNAGFNLLMFEDNWRTWNVSNGQKHICGNGMECNFWIDDLIVDDQRIGPKYFSFLNGTPSIDTNAPSVPTNLTVTPISSSQINLSWTASTDNTAVTGYKIYRCAGSGCASTIQIATSTTNSYSNTGLTASTAYTYAVSAYDAAGNESTKSSSVSATTLSQFKQADFNKDGIVNQLDFDILKQEWARTDKPRSDLNQDGIVDSRDLGIMMSEWSR